MKTQFAAACLSLISLMACTKTEVKSETVEHPDGSITKSTTEVVTAPDSAKIKAAAAKVKEKLGTAGEKLKEATDNTGEKIEKTANKTEAQLKEAAKATGERLKEAGQDIKNTKVEIKTTETH